MIQMCSCSELNGGFQQEIYAYVLIPGTSECYLIWEKSL